VKKNIGALHDAQTGGDDAFDGGCHRRPAAGETRTRRQDGMQFAGQEIWVWGPSEEG
jgi:hypothetical protein